MDQAVGGRSKLDFHQLLCSSRGQAAATRVSASTLDANALQECWFSCRCCWKLSVPNRNKTAKWTNNDVRVLCQTFHSRFLLNWVWGGGDDQRTVVSTRPPRSERTVQNSVQPQQHPADAEAQQQAEHQVHLLLGHTVTHKVVLWRVHQGVVPVVRDDVVDMMPAATKREDLPSELDANASLKTGVQCSVFNLSHYLTLL